jgi:hypothetical protein
MPNLQNPDQTLIDQAGEAFRPLEPAVERIASEASRVAETAVCTAVGSVIDEVQGNVASKALDETIDRTPPQIARFIFAARLVSNFTGVTLALNAYSHTANLANCIIEIYP